MSSQPAHVTVLKRTVAMHCGYQTSIFGKNCAYYIQIFTVVYMYSLLCVFISQLSNKVDFISMGEA